jgi:mannosyltransferase
MLSGVVDTESTPHLYYALAWLWAKVFGSGEVGLRSLSALLGTAAIPVAHRAAAELISERAGLVTAAIVATNPFLVWYSQEARAYALLTLTAGVTFLLFARALYDPGRRSLVLWGVAAAIALASHYFAIFVVVPEAVWLLARHREQRREVALSCAGVGVVGLALLPVALEQASHASADWIGQIGLGTRLRYVPQRAIGGQVGGTLPTLELGPLLLVTLVVVGLAGLALWLLVDRADDRERRGAWVAAVIGGAAVVAPILLTVLNVDYFFDRNLLAAAVPLAIVPAAGLGARRAGALGAGGAALLAAVWIGVLAWVNLDRRVQREDWRGAAEAIRASAGPQDRAIVLSPFAAQKVLPIYLPGVDFLPPGIPVQEIVVLGQYREGARRPPTPPAPALGFGLVERREAPTYTLLRYRAERPIPVPEYALAGMRLGRDQVVLLE